MIKAVIFDLDDTLISEKKYIISGYRHIAKILSTKLNINEHDIFNLLFELFNMSPKYVFNRFFDIKGIDYSQSMIFDLVDEYRNHLPNIEYFNDVIPTIEIIKQKKVKTGIITDGFKNAQLQKLKAINAKNYFDEIIVTDELGKEYWKPHPKAFEMMKEKLGIEFHEMVYIGDNPRKDFHISIKYPIKAIRISRENGIYCMEENPKEINVFHELTDFKNLNGILFGNIMK